MNPIKISTGLMLAETISIEAKVNIYIPPVYTKKPLDFVVRPYTAG